MAMTRKHFQAFATMFCCVRTDRRYQVDTKKAEKDVDATLDMLAKELCSIFSHDNGRFDSGRFLRACGVRSAG